jgi:uncharacterized phage-associated protein
MANVFDVAKYIINSIEVDNLKLQKLLYYSQAVHLVLSENKSRLFDDRIEAWQYGPVVPPVYRKYKKNGLDVIKKSGEIKQLSAQEIESLDIALSYYGKMTAFDLVIRTHNESPWKDVYDPNKRNTIISTDSIYNFYKGKFKFEQNAD